jgi:ribose transport system substrate-binding protein
MKKFKTLSLLLIVALLIVVLISCTSTPSESASPAESTAVESAATETASTDASESSASGIPEIYLIEDRNALSGVISSTFYDSRADIPKALPTESKSNLVIGLVPCTLDNPYYVARDQAAKDKAAEYGYTVNIVSSNWDIAGQTKAVETLVTQGVDAIILDPVDAPSAQTVCKYAVDNGIPVFGVGNALDRSANIVTTVLANQYMNGWECGIFAAQQYTGKDINCLVVLGQMGYSVADSRIDGMLGGIIYQRLTENGQDVTKEDAMLEGWNMLNDIRDTGRGEVADANLKVVGYGEGGWTEEGGLSATETLLTANADANLLLAENDFMGIGAVRAIESANLTIGPDGIQVACAADGTKGAFDLIRQDKMLCTGYNCPMMGGEYAVELIHMVFEEGYDANNLPVEISYQPVCINKENVDQYQDPNSDFTVMQPLEFKTIDEIQSEKPF